MLCYTGVLAIGLAGAFRSPWVLAAVAAAGAAGGAAILLLPEQMVPSTLRNLLFLGAPFGVGVAFYVFRSRIPLSPALVLALVAATAVANGTPLYRPLLLLSVCYGVFVLAYVPRGFIRRYNALGDFSYGIYIYAWPIQQTAILFFGPMGPLGNIALAAPATLAFAWLSWNLGEKPALALVPHSDPRPEIGLSQFRIRTQRKIGPRLKRPETTRRSHAYDAD